MSKGSHLAKTYLKLGLNRPLVFFSDRPSNCILAKERAAKFKTVGAKAIAFVTGEEQGSDSDSGLNYSGV